MTARRTAAALTVLAALTVAAPAPAHAATRYRSAKVTTVVPYVVGLDEQAASQRVRRAGLKPHVTIQKGSGDYPVTTVYTRPGAGTRLPFGTEVTIVLGE
ncbi:PASTA domain-containing protein [Micromonospora sp. DPT]|uniref:PASTA domain-containing protein n=1 Tax=Micromonospora sp. DPT TaxID=3142975 RepID=UPI0032083162